MGQVVRAGVLLIMATLTYWKIGALAGAVLLLAALALGILAGVAFTGQ